MASRPTGSETDWIQTIQENREDLEALANTDLPAADWARYLLHLADDHRHTPGSDPRER